MMRESVEHFFACPYCWEEISMVLEPQWEEQVYVEDCEVCCRPIEIRFWGDDEGLTGFEAASIEQ